MTVTEKAHRHAFPLAEGSKFSYKDYFHDNDIIDITNFFSFRPERRARAKRQIANLIKKMEVHSHLKSYCISKIKDLIGYELNISEQKEKDKNKMFENE